MESFRLFWSVPALLLIGGCSHRAEPPKYQFVELVKVAGQCSEDHARQAGRYVGQIVHYYTPATGRHMRYGSVTDVDAMSVERMKQQMEDPARYSPPFIVEFANLSAEDIAGTSLTLPGISERPGHDNNNSGGFHSTCQLTVTERLDHPPWPSTASE